MNSLKSKRTTETRMAVVDFTQKLDTDEELSGTPTVNEIGTADLTISSEAITDDDIMVDGFPVVSGKAVTFLVADGLAGKEYTVRVTVDTDDGQTLSKAITFRVN